MKDITLITPTHLDTAMTGFRLGAEKMIRGRRWRVEFHTGEKHPRFSRDGEAVPKDKATAEAWRLALAATGYLPK